jgi:peptidyl-prolyl cis-trans isomerase A (cyclophilin A)
MFFDRFSRIARVFIALFAITLGVISLRAQAAAAPKVKLSTSMGDIVVELYPDKAPKTVANFLQYVQDKHYDGTIFHRVIGTFMVQGGGFTPEYSEKKSRAPIAHEGREALAKGLKNTRGMLAMARTNDPVKKFEYQGRTYENVPRANLLNSAQLWGYTVFGKVIQGMDVVDKIKATPTGAGGPFSSDVPKSAVIVKSATVLKSF